jgi:hypothetical protein
LIRLELRRGTKANGEASHTVSTTGEASIARACKVSHDGGGRFSPSKVHGEDR